MYEKKVLDDFRMLKDESYDTKDVREKLCVKDVNFLTYLETRNKNVEINTIRI